MCVSLPGMLHVVPVHSPISTQAPSPDCPSHPGVEVSSGSRGPSPVALTQGFPKFPNHESPRLPYLLNQDLQCRIPGSQGFLLAPSLEMLRSLGPLNCVLAAPHLPGDYDAQPCRQSTLCSLETGYPSVFLEHYDYGFLIL